MERERKTRLEANNCPWKQHDKKKEKKSEDEKGLGRLTDKTGRHTDTTVDNGPAAGLAALALVTHGLHCPQHNSQLPNLQWMEPGSEVLSGNQHPATYRTTGQFHPLHRISMTVPFLGRPSLSNTASPTLPTSQEGPASSRDSNPRRNPPAAGPSGNLARLACLVLLIPQPPHRVLSLEGHGSCISQATPENPCPQARRFLRLGTFDLASGNLLRSYCISILTLAAPYAIFSTPSHMLQAKTRKQHRGKQRWGADAEASSEKIPWNNCHTDLNFHNAQKKK
ncbi:hypothetical protein CCHR01_09894 [Colletotrichum chrysophilum]|uniref:Uncharacterized protein n=1 Tax=Colletotrichum chrysophilum TaxID=1836956 RepID=A0AAD9AFZ4_9PEZI|nr:hypothetical protein CCHR01_09894 [Colletotrichum chrysophilum]